MNKFKPGTDILPLYDRKTKQRSNPFNFAIGDMVMLKDKFYFLDQLGNCIYLVPMYDTTTDSRQITITELQDKGYIVMGNIDKNPMLKILYGK